MTYIDYIIVAIMAFSCVISLFRGFVREAMSIVSWLAALWVAWHFYSVAAMFLTDYISKESLRGPVAFVALFIITMILGSLVNFLFGQLVDKTGLSSTDRILGLAFGLVRGVIVVGILLMLMRFTPISSMESFQHSQLVPVFVPIENWLHSFIPSDMQSNFVMLKNL